MQPPKKTELLSSLIKSKLILNAGNCSNITHGAAVVFNTESAYFYYKNTEYRSYVQNCSYIAIDGVVLSLVLRLIGVSADRFHGPDLLKVILSSIDSAYKVIAGGSECNVRLVDSGAVDLFVDLPFTSDVDLVAKLLVDRVSQIPKKDEKIYIFISLGLPKQELVSLRLLSHLQRQKKIIPNDVVIIPIGAAVDFLSGAKVRSGLLWQKLGLEWLPRLLREPRMFPRIVRSLMGMYFLIKSDI